MGRFMCRKYPLRYWCDPWKVCAKVFPWKIFGFRGSVAFCVIRGSGARLGDVGSAGSLWCHYRHRFL